MTYAHDIIIRPIISEQSMAQIADRKYTFVVAKCANKIEIKKAVEEIFGVNVEKVIKPDCPLVIFIVVLSSSIINIISSLLLNLLFINKNYLLYIHYFYPKKRRLQLNML